MSAHREWNPRDRRAIAPVTAGGGVITEEGVLRTRPLASGEGGGLRSENGGADEGNEGKCDGGREVHGELVGG